MVGASRCDARTAQRAVPTSEMKNFVLHPFKIVVSARGILCGSDSTLAELILIHGATESRPVGHEIYASAGAAIALQIDGLILILWHHVYWNLHGHCHSFQEWRD